MITELNNTDSTLIIHGTKEGQVFPADFGIGSQPHSAIQREERPSVRDGR
jgi:hypothetical protein